MELLVHATRHPSVRRAGLALIVLATFLTPAAVRAQPLAPSDFAPAAIQGFGDRDNSLAWSMIWWEKHQKFFVGTGRSSYCVGVAVHQLQHPRWPLYPPPPSADTNCPDDVADLRLQAEIWSWSPATSTWTLLYRSPNNIPIPDRPGRFTSRDGGFRGMRIVTEPNGTEALYVSGVSNRVIYEESFERYLTDPQLPPPRLMRSTDGATFQPVPQDPGTLLAELVPLSGFRGMITLNGRAYVIASVGVAGFGHVLESADPARGNDSFRKIQVTADDLTIFEIAAYNGALYVVTGGIPSEGASRVSVLKTSATGPLPYTFTEVVPPGAYHPGRDAAAAYSMFVFEGRLYVGTSREVLRINPDDTWEVVVGAARTTPLGPMAPLSGLDDGFGFDRNIHMWRMTTHEGALYVGTLDSSTDQRNLVGGDKYANVMGFDLYATTDGWRFTRVTRTGFAEPGTGPVFDHGGRGLASSPHGLFVGSANPYYGLNVWRGQRSADAIPAPQALEAETVGRRVVLSWEQPPAVSGFRVLRENDTRATQEIDVRDPLVFGGTWVAVDASSTATLEHNYQVVAVDGAGRRSGPSNLAVKVSAAAPVVFPSVQSALEGWDAPASWLAQLAQARSRFQGGGACRGPGTAACTLDDRRPGAEPGEPSRVEGGRRADAAGEADSARGACPARTVAGGARVLARALPSRVAR